MRKRHSVNPTTQPTQKHLPRLKTQPRRRKRHIYETGISAAARKKTYIRARKVVVTVVTTKLYIYNHMNINNKTRKIGNQLT